MGPEDAAAWTSPELSFSESEDEIEPAADSPQSSTQGCEKLRLIVPPAVRRLRLFVKISVPKEACPPPQKLSARLEMPKQQKEEFLT